MKKKNLYLYIPLIIIIIYSILNIYNAKLLNNDYSFYYIKQIIWFCIGIIIIFICQKINIYSLFKYSIYLYIFSCLLLVLVLVIGKEINGAKAWFDFYFFSFQPSELMRLSLTLFLSEFTIKNYKKKYYIILTILFTLIPSILVFLEPDTGAIIFYLIIMFAILYNSKTNKNKLLILTIFFIALIIIFVLIFIFKKNILIHLLGSSFYYRIDRIINFYNNSGYQIENALTSISCASLFGVGINKILIYIPEGLTDFIFAFSAGNYGIISTIIILLCYFIIDFYFIKKAYKIKNKLNKLFITSFIAFFFFQQFYNILMNVNLVPIMGIPLPFLSYGGSTILIYSVFIGLIINIINNKTIYSQT